MLLNNRTVMKDGQTFTFLSRIGDAVGITGKGKPEEADLNKVYFFMYKVMGHRTT